MQHPPDNYEQMKVTDMLQGLSWIFLMTIYSVGVFWALLVKRPGTVGTGAYLLDFCGGFFLILALSQNSWPYDQVFFVGSLILLVIMLLWHIQATMKQPAHVHTKCVGQSRFQGDGTRPEAYELLTGFGVAAIFSVFGLLPYGFFIVASASANFLRDGLIEERDRLRATQWADAEWEMQYHQNNYENWKRKHNRG